MRSKSARRMIFLLNTPRYAEPVAALNSCTDTMGGSDHDDVGGVADDTNCDHLEDCHSSIPRSPSTSSPPFTNVWRVVSLPGGGAQSESVSFHESLDLPLREYVSTVQYLWVQDRPREVHIPQDFFVECVAFPVPSLSHVTAISSHPINLKQFVVSGFVHIEVSGDDFFDEPDTMCIAFCSCCEHGERSGV